MDFYEDIIQPVGGFCIFCLICGGIYKSCSDSDEPTYSTTPSIDKYDDDLSDSPSPTTHPAQPVYPVGGGNAPVGSSSYDTYSGGSSSQGQTQQHERKWHDCSLCHGKGTIVRDSYVSTYGQEDPMVYCAECGRSWLQSTGHHHVTCPTCHGNKGWWSE